MMYSVPAPQSGFTLVELSIVLVIIGLVVGGVVAGQSLIRQAELQSVITDVNKFAAAVNVFETKYGCLPGDCGNASSLSLGTNGDGNGVVDDGWCTSPQDTSNAGNAEQFLFWQHLGNAGLIAGVYTGQAGTNAAIEAIIGVNVPSSKIAATGYSLVNPTNNGCAGALFAGPAYNSTITFGSQIGGDRTLGPILRTSEAFNLDKKIDDGSPTTGKVLTLNSSWFSRFGTPTCVTSDSSNALYNLNINGPSCHVMFSGMY